MADKNPECIPVDSVPSTKKIDLWKKQRKKIRHQITTTCKKILAAVNDDDSRGDLEGLMAKLEIIHREIDIIHTKLQSQVFDDAKSGKNEKTHLFYMKAIEEAYEKAEYFNTIKPVAEPEIIPDILFDPDTKKGYVRGEFLGKAEAGVKVEPATADTPFPAVPSGPLHRQLLLELQQQLLKLSTSKPEVNNEKVPFLMDEAEDPAAIPKVWVSKWVDYSDKYGVAYQLSDDTFGVNFNDITRLLLHPDGKAIQFVERNGMEKFHTLDSYHPDLEDKMKLLAFFRSYLKASVIKVEACHSVHSKEDKFRPLTFLRRLLRTSPAVAMHLANGTLQVNFFYDHVKIILCPVMGAVTVIDEKKNFQTYRLTTLAKYGCSTDLLQRLKFVGNDIIPKMIY